MRSDTQGSKEMDAEEDLIAQGVESAVLSLTHMTPLSDLLSEPHDGQNLKTIQTSPMPMPTLTRDQGQEGTEGGPASLDPGQLSLVIR